MTALEKHDNPNKKMVQFTFEEIKNMIKKAIMYIKENEDINLYKFYIFDVEISGWINYSKICNELDIEF